MTLPVERVRALSFHALHEPPRTLPDGRVLRRLNLNESPFPPAPRVAEAMAQAAAGAHLYPDGEARALVEALSAQTGVAADRIFVGAGSNELLAASAEIALDPGDEMIAPTPAFPTYAKLAALRAAGFVGIPTDAAGRIDVAAILEAVTARTRLVFVSSPHNPTGAIMRAAEIRALAKGLPAQVMLHFDEAYFEFGRAAGAPDALPILAERSGPWIATRTFSKAHGLAGARVGYGFAGAPELALAIRKVRSNFSLSRMALAGALAALEDRDTAPRLVAHLLAERDRIVAALAPRGFVALEGAANFVALLPPPDAPDLVAALRDEGILVVSFALGEQRALRVTIGTRDDTEAVIAALARRAG